jgi:dienelactone hydrolase
VELLLRRALAIQKNALQSSGAHHKTLLYPAEHAFTRDEGPRFDPKATDLAFAERVRLFRDHLGCGCNLRIG